MRRAAVSAAIEATALGGALALALVTRTARAQVSSGAPRAATTALGVGDVRALARQVADDYVRRAVALEAEGRALAATELFRRALDADAALLEAHLGYARALAARGRADDARRALAEVPAYALEGAAPRVRYAAACEALGAFELAAAALRGSPDDVAAQRALVALSVRAERFAEALAAARRIEELVRAGDEAEQRAARTMARALARVVGAADAVRAPPAGSPPLRLALARE